MDRNAINNRLRDYAFSGRAQTAEIPYLYGLRDGQGGPQPLNALGGSAGDLGRGGDLPSLVGSASPSAPADTGLIGPGQVGDDANFLLNFFATGADGRRYDNGDGGRGQDGPPDTGFSDIGPLDDLNSNILDTISNVPGFGLAVGLRRGADFLGIPGVNTPASFGTPGTPEFARNIEAYRAARQRSRERFANRLDSDTEVAGDFSFGGPTDTSFGVQDSDVFGADPAGGRDGSSFGGDGLDSGVETQSDVSIGPPTDSSFGAGLGDFGGGRSGGEDGGRGGGPGDANGTGEGGGSGGHVGGEYHDGGYVDESIVPGERRADVQATIQEGEHVITADAVEMFGQDFFDKINKIAKMGRGG